MTDPQDMSDADLVRAYLNHPDPEGDEAEALLAEIQRRELDF